MSVRDLDDLVSDLRVRPSILIPSYELLGKSIGLLSKLAPKSFSKVIDEIIEEATTQQFNDSLRSLVGTDANDDIKITLKIHRDFNNTNINNDDTKNNNNNNNNNNSSSSSSSKVCSGTLYHVLKLSQYT
jgi:demethoxyubiquinone hydroxylase (CLK1/Coq7/Cat5 family)